MCDAIILPGNAPGSTGNPRFEARNTSDNTSLTTSSESTTDEPGRVQSIARGELTVEVARYLAATTSLATQRAYKGDVEDFIRWGGRVPCGPAALAQYVAERATVHKVSTLVRRVVGIGKAHAMLGAVDPSKSELIRAVLRGVRRQHGVAQRRARPILVEHLHAMFDRRRSEPRDVRDRALILLGFATAMRRSELVGLDVEDLAFVPAGMTVCIRRSKTDQDARGRLVAVPFGRSLLCPVRAVEEWLAVAAIGSGCVFPSVTAGDVVLPRRLPAQTVASVVKQLVAKIGLDPANYSGHSLRAGLVTSASRLGITVGDIQRQTGHRSTAILARYVRDDRLFDGNAAGALL